MKKAFGLALLIVTGVHVCGQTKLSFTTDLSVMGNFSPKQQFYTIGQTIQFDVHLTPKNTFYTWFIYHSPGRFENDYKGMAKSPTTTPSEINYKVKGEWRMREFSMGWKLYIKGAFNSEYDWNLYGIAGLGFMFTKANNLFKPEIDTNLYAIPATPISGKGTIDRLTVDLGLGFEIPIGGDFFTYADLRTCLPASSYPSPYLHSTKNVPMTVMVNIGIRILFANY